jgi:tRNA (adenine57-N1/adenine58-N1)-methyltransferase
MHGHTGFLVTSRRLAPGVTPPERTRRPAKGSQPVANDASSTAEAGADDAPAGRSVEPARTPTDEPWDAAALGERPVSEKKIRRVRRTVTQTSEQ